MGRNLLTVFLVSAGLLLAATVFAHHSQSAEFDRTKPIEFSGVVKAVEWTNPHSYTQVETREPDGKVLVYRVESTAPNQLFRAGWRRDTVKVGTPVQVKAMRSRDPKSMNISGDMTLPDGKVAFRGPGPMAAAGTNN